MYHGHDWGSVARGRQVYTEVFAPCHSLDALSFRHLQEFMSIEMAKEYAAECEVDADPDKTGAVEKRPAILIDKLPRPYDNEQAAKFSNGGAYPPDLSLITKGRDGGENYIFSLMTSYGRPVPEGLSAPSSTVFWNPYFPGGWIGMPAPLSDEMIDFDDGTPASVSQMSKDVCCFLSWCAEPWMDERKYSFTKLQLTSMAVIPFTFYWYKTRFNMAKLRRLRVCGCYFLYLLK